MRNASRYAGPRRGVAHRVEEESHLGEPEVAVEAVGEVDHLDVDVGIVDPEHLRAELPVLAVPALLRALVPEVRREVPDLPRRRRPVLHVRAHDRRGALGPQREVATALVVELVHLLAHDVGGRADALEHLDVLEDRRDHEAVAVPAGARRERGDRVHPQLGLGREDVVRADGRAIGRRPSASGTQRG